MILGLVELAAIAGFIAFRDRACPIVTANRAGGASAAGGAALPLSAGGGGSEAGSSGPAQTPQAPPPSVSSGSQAGAGANSDSGGSGSAQAQGDVNQVPDPNCVAKTTAGLLNSEPAASTPPSCAPMSPPPALKQAEQQVQAGATP